MPKPRERVKSLSQTMAEIASEISLRKPDDPQELPPERTLPPISLQEHLERMKLELEKVMGSTKADRLDWLLGKPRRPKS